VEKNHRGKWGTGKREMERRFHPLIRHVRCGVPGGTWSGRRWGSVGTLSAIQRSDGHKAEARKDKLASVHFLAVGLKKCV
jgi:hypothetical protein